MLVGIQQGTGHRVLGQTASTRSNYDFSPVLNTPLFPAESSQGQGERTLNSNFARGWQFERSSACLGSFFPPSLELRNAAHSAAYFVVRTSLDLKFISRCRSRLPWRIYVSDKEASTSIETFHKPLNKVDEELSPSEMKV